MKFCDICGCEILFDWQFGKTETESQNLGVAGSKQAKTRYTTTTTYCSDCAQIDQDEYEKLSNSDEAKIISNFENWAEEQVE